MSDVTGKPIKESFDEFHAKNPKVYEMFLKYIREIYATGKRKMSSKMILNRVRWEVYMLTDSKDCFKINDAYTAHYARLFAELNPKFKHLFNYRGIRSK